MKIGIVDLRHVGLLVGACFAEIYNFFFYLLNVKKLEIQILIKY